MMHVQPKIDGSLVYLYAIDDDTLGVSSKGSLNGPIPALARSLLDAPTVLAFLRRKGILTLGVEVVHPSNPQVERRRTEGLYLLSVVRLAHDLVVEVGIDELDEAVSAAEAASLGLSTLRVDACTVAEVESRLASLDAVESIDEIKEGYVSKPAGTREHATHEYVRAVGAATLQSHLDDAVAAKQVVRKRDGALTLYVYTDWYNTTAPADWNPVVRAAGRGTVFHTDACGETRVVCYAMSKFFGASPSDAASTDEPCKLKSSLYLRFAKSTRPTAAFVGELVSKHGLDGAVRVVDGASTFVLDGKGRALGLLAEVRAHAGRVVDAARALPHATRQELGKDKGVPSDVKAVAFLHMGGVAESALLASAAKAVARAMGKA